jgi:putative heme-binding domain-containing protein
MAEALRGWRKARPPEGWAELQTRLAASPEKAVRDLAREVGVVFGDGRALTELRQLVVNTSADGAARRAALQVLIDSRPDDLRPLLHKLLRDRSTAGLAARGLASFDHPDTPRLILAVYGTLDRADRPEAINTLTSRPAYAAALLQAVADGRVPREDISAFHARQMRSLGDDKLTQRLAQVWGEVRGTAADKKQLIAKYKQVLMPERLKTANLSRGRLVFNQTCATCHLLYGEGKKVGPDLTGSGRDNVDYLLERLLDPSALVSAEFRMSVVTLKNGRVLTGVVGEKTERTLAVQTQTERIRLDRSEIEEVRPTTVSLMPEGLLSPLSEVQVRDLIAYLMARRQVPLP